MLDTNVVIRHFISRRRGRKQSPNRRIFELWFIEGQLQLIICQDIAQEYLTTLDVVLGIPEKVLGEWEERFFNHRVDVVSPGRRYGFSRDPKDNVFLAVAAVGKADFLITNDRDLLEINEADKQRLKFRIVTPGQFFEEWEMIK